MLLIIYKMDIALLNVKVKDGDKKNPRNPYTVVKTGEEISEALEPTVRIELTFPLYQRGVLSH